MTWYWIAFLFLGAISLLSVLQDIAKATSRTADELTRIRFIDETRQRALDQALEDTGRTKPHH